jgi:hypothetical protein
MLNFIQISHGGSGGSYAIHVFDDLILYYIT